MVNLPPQSLLLGGLTRRTEGRRILVAPWLTFGSLLTPFGSLWAPFGSLLAPLWLHLGSLWLPFGSLRLLFGALGLHFYAFGSISEHFRVILQFSLAFWFHFRFLRSDIVFFH